MLNITHSGGFRIRATRALIHTSRLLNNLEVLRNHVGLGNKLCAAVKADAYGHGAVLIARRLKEAGVSHLGVATVEEGLELRRAGITGAILLYGALQDDEWADAVGCDLQPLVSSRSHVELLAEAGRQAGKVVPVHLKIDTGMGRLGCPPEVAGELAHSIVHNLHLEFEGLCTHFASSEAPGPISVARQLERFGVVLDELDSRGFEARYVHAANSGALLGQPDYRAHATRFNLARPGISLYGYPPDRDQPIAGLRPVLELVSRVAHLKTVGAGTALSYGSRYITREKSDVATVPIGYADGYRRSFTNLASLLVGGRLYHVSGTVCMDQLLVDVGPDSGLSVGDEVVLLGEARPGEPSPPDADDLAALAGTISYEILCGLARRVPRVEVPVQ
ncbi:MAG: alanine racemase [Spirochaetales bacterium]